MSKRAGAKKGRRMNSYLKMGIVMLIGACVGAFMAVGFMSSEDIIVNLIDKTASGISGNLFLITTLLAVISILICSVSYWKAEKILKSSANCGDDEAEEEMECRFDMWSTMVIMGSEIMMLMGMMLLGFISMERGVWTWNTTGVIIPFIILAVSSGFFQIAAVRQVQRKDPSKKGDPSDLRFNKDWLESCDEAEREIAFRASYKTFQFTKYAMLAGVMIALFGQFHWNTGLAPLILIGANYIMMTVVYGIYTVKIQKSKLND